MTTSSRTRRVVHPKTQKTFRYCADAITFPNATTLNSVSRQHSRLDTTCQAIENANICFRRSSSVQPWPADLNCKCCSARDCICRTMLTRKGRRNVSDGAKQGRGMAGVVQGLGKMPVAAPESLQLHSRGIPVGVIRIVEFSVACGCYDSGNHKFRAVDAGVVPEQNWQARLCHPARPVIE